MMKFMVMFSYAADDTQAEDAYNDFLGLVERMPDVARRQVVHITGSPNGNAPYNRILEIYFDDKETMQAALMSPVGQEAGGELRRFSPDALTVMFADVYEE